MTSVSECARSSRYSDIERKAVMVFILKGSVRHEFGPGCSDSVVHSAGDMFYIEPGLPHEVFNCSETDWVEAIVSRSDASEWQNIVSYDRESE